jgi:hypothetical protein
MTDDPFFDDDDDQPIFANDRPVADDGVGSRWRRLIATKRATDPEHEWCRMFHELISAEVLKAHETGKRWKITEPLGLLLLLEEQAKHHGLIEGDAPLMTAQEAVGMIASTLGMPSA